MILEPSFVGFLERSLRWLCSNPAGFAFLPDWCKPSKSFSLHRSSLFYFWNRSNSFSIFFSFFRSCSIFKYFPLFFNEYSERLLSERLIVRSTSCREPISPPYECTFLWFRLFVCCVCLERLGLAPLSIRGLPLNVTRTCSYGS